MTYPLFFGCLLVAFGPLFAVFCMLIAPNDQMVILTVGSSFFWLLAIMLTAIIWYIITPMHQVHVATVLLSVIIQEFFRFVFYMLYVKSERVLKPRSGLGASTISNRLYASIAAGVGVGGMYCLLMYTSVLWKATGPATLFSQSCPATNLFIVNALMACSFSFLHVFQSILAFDGYRYGQSKRGIFQIGMVALSHLSASMISILNSKGGSCIAGVIGTILITVATGAATWLIVKRHYIQANR